MIFREQEDCTKSSLTDEQMQQMIKFCVGKQRLFYCTRDIEKDSRNLLETTLKNYTGFQRIALMLVVGILNSNEKQAVIQDCTSWRIERRDDASCNQILRVIRMPLENNSENAVTFIHEAGHAYNTMLFGKVDDRNANNISRFKSRLEEGIF